MRDTGVLPTLCRLLRDVVMLGRFEKMGIGPGQRTCQKYQMARKKKGLLRVKICLQIEKHAVICSSHINKNLLEGCLYGRDY
jgi:hypothetical protein